jgi:hypothetical protein
MTSKRDLLADVRKLNEAAYDAIRAAKTPEENRGALLALARQIDEIVDRHAS